LNKEDIKAAAKEAAALSLKEIPGVLMEVGAASKSVRHYKDINATAKEGAALSLAEIRGVSMEVGAASKSVVQYFPSTLNSDDVLGKFCTQISMQLLLPSKNHGFLPVKAPLLL
jgi:hypothetical protein